MSHRKYEAPRHGSLAFLPRKRCRRGHGRVRAFPKDDPSMKPHLTAFMGYKAGMTHVVREIERPGSKMNKREVVEAVTLIEAPAMMIVGLVGYAETAAGWKAIKTVWASHLSEEMRRRYYKKWYKSKKQAFVKSSVRASNKESFAEDLDFLKKQATRVRAIAHTQVTKVACLKQKKAHIMEIQVNGGSIPEKVDFAVGMFEQAVSISSVFSNLEMVDTIAITKGKGFQGVVKRWGVTRLPRKTHRGLRKVACIGAWHPARVQFQVPRHGQMGYHHRTYLNKRIYRIGNGKDPRSGTTESDITEKAITPMGGFPHYGIINNDFLMIRGSVQGPKKRVIALRKAMFPPVSRQAQEDVVLKFIDTSSKFGNGRFQTSEEKSKFFGPMKVM